MINILISGFIYGIILPSMSGSVSNLSISSSFPSSPLIITWNPPQSPNGEIVQYFIWVQNKTNQCVLNLTMNCTGCTNNITNFGLPDNNTNVCKSVSGSTFYSNTTALSITINDSVILPYSDYMINVRPLNEFGWEILTNKSIKTNQYLSGSVSNLSISSSFTSSPLIITWNPPQSPNGEIVQYFIWVQNNNTNQCVLKLTMNCTGCTNNITNFGLPDNNTNVCKSISGSTFYSNKTTLSITINDSVIIACTDYLINVRPLNGFGWGNLTNKSIKINQYVLDSVNNLMCINSSYNSIWCTWSPPIVMNGVILNYHILCINCTINTTLSNTTISINITNNIIPDVLYNIEITPNNICGRGATTNYSITIGPAIDAEVINELLIPGVMNNSKAQLSNGAHEISIILPFNHFTNNRGRIIKYTVVINQVIDKNINPIKYKGSITSSSAYYNKTYACYTVDTNCAYEIDVTDKKNINRVKRAADTQPQNTEFTIGNTKPSNNLSDYTNNGQLRQNTEYQIAFRAYTSAGFITVGYIRKSTEIDIGLAFGLAIFCLLLVAGVTAITLLRRRIWHNRPPEETIIIRVETPIPVLSDLVRDYHVYFEHMKQDSGGKLSDEYQEIKDEAKKLERNRTLVFTDGNDSKNRYGNIKPYQHNRLKLLDKDDYINASKICTKHWDMNILNQCTCTDIYIATQGPIAENKEPKVSTIGDFWRMIIENNVCIIVNLTKCEESGKEKCSQYWPDKVTDKIRKSCGNGSVEVTLLYEKVNPIFTERQLKVSMNQKERVVKQFHMTSWLDHSCPKTEDFLKLYSAYQNARISKEAVVVHCSAGVGRTGTFILIDEELSRIRRDTDKIEISKNFLNLRKCRCQMVQTESQYCFIHTVIYDYLHQKGLLQIPEHITQEPLAKKYKYSYDNPIFNGRD